MHAKKRLKKGLTATGTGPASEAQGAQAGAAAGLRLESLGAWLAHTRHWDSNVQARKSFPLVSTAVLPLHGPGRERRRAPGTVTPGATVHASGAKIMR